MPRCDYHHPWSTVERCPHKAVHRVTITIPSAYAGDEPSGRTGDIIISRNACTMHAERTMRANIGQVLIDPLTTA